MFKMDSSCFCLKSHELRSLLKFIFCGPKTWNVKTFITKFLQFCQAHWVIDKLIYMISKEVGDYLQCQWTCAKPEWKNPRKLMIHDYWTVEYLSFISFVQTGNWMTRLPQILCLLDTSHWGPQNKEDGTDRPSEDEPSSHLPSPLWHQRRWVLTLNITGNEM